MINNHQPKYCLFCCDLAIYVWRRVMSRGRVGAPASDFGGLEVFGEASIGATDPFRVAAELRKRVLS